MTSGLTYAKKHIDLMFSIGEQGRIDLYQLSRTYGCDHSEALRHFGSRAAKPDPCRFDDDGGDK